MNVPVSSWPPSSYTSSSCSALPMPKPTAPTTCPSTITWSMMVPQSSTQMYCSTFTLPVSASTRTKARCAPCPKVWCGGSKVRVACNPRSMLSGSDTMREASWAAAATFAKDTLRDGSAVE